MNGFRHRLAELVDAQIPQGVITAAQTPAAHRAQVNRSPLEIEAALLAIGEGDFQMHRAAGAALQQSGTGIEPQLGGVLAVDAAQHGAIQSDRPLPLASPPPEHHHYRIGRP